ncbi:hypothetical protein EVAR_48969_1 [Eumeta japonica]|uniref:Uncharacterized protein n=1 Tax=Eumeta variegata TaxID=151549 RepID=A0A4C1Y410_EUMVA|nr:hypothetical protein EVAR_48969_1 [Eumeta japonica]
MHRRDVTEIGLVLAELHKSDTAKDIFKFSREYAVSAVPTNAPPQPSATKTSLLWPEKPREQPVTSPAVSPVANAWFRTPPRDESEPVNEATREPQSRPQPNRRQSLPVHSAKTFLLLCLCCESSLPNSPQTSEKLGAVKTT